MAEASGLSVAERLKDRVAITAAIQRAVREALLAHARAGNPIAAWRDGQVVWIQPEEIFATLGRASSDAQKPSL